MFISYFEHKMSCLAALIISFVAKLTDSSEPSYGYSKPDECYPPVLILFPLTMWYSLIIMPNEYY